MIVQFTAVDTETFTGSFDSRRIDIRKQPTGDWRVFVNQTPTKTKADSARACMFRVEEIANKLIQERISTVR